MLLLATVLFMSEVRAGRQKFKIVPMVAQGARVDIGPAAVIARLDTGTATEEERLRIMSTLQAVAERMGSNLQFVLGCILAFSSHHVGPPPEDIMRALIAEMGDACTAATLQIGMDQLIQWVPGELHRRPVQMLRLRRRHVGPRP